MSRYGYSQETKSEVFNVAGINEGWYFVDAKFDYPGKEAKGSKAFIVNFIHRKSKTPFKMVFFDVNEENVIKFNKQYPSKHKYGTKKGEPVTDEEAIELRFKDLVTNHKHLMTKFVPEEQAVVEADNYEDMCVKEIGVILASPGKEDEMRLKLVYDKKGNLTLPKNRPWIENVKKTPKTSMTISAEYDIIVRPAQQKEGETSGANSSTESGDNPW